jgi:copper resistance protein C
MVKWISAAAPAMVIAATVCAYAHALLDHASPPVGGRVASSPPMLELTFTEGVVPHFSSVEVLGPSGQAVHTGPLRTGNAARELIVPLPTLAPGRYTVIWHVTSQDTHKTEGRFSFTVAP